MNLAGKVYRTPLFIHHSSGFQLPCFLNPPKQCNIPTKRMEALHQWFSCIGSERMQTKRMYQSLRGLTPSTCVSIPPPWPSIAEQGYKPCSKMSWLIRFVLSACKAQWNGTTSAEREHQTSLLTECELWQTVLLSR